MSNKRTILLIDDDVDDTELFCDAVNEVDDSINCIFVNDSEDALKLLCGKECAKPDYIFLDLNMPRMNGKQLLRQIKKVEELKEIPVIIYTTAKLPEEMEETSQLGAVYFLTKPSQLSTLKKAITYILSGQWKLMDTLN